MAFHLVPLLFRLQVFWKIAFMGKHFPCQFLNDKVSEHEGKVYPEILFPLSASFYKVNGLMLTSYRTENSVILFVQYLTLDGFIFHQFPAERTLP